VIPDSWTGKQPAIDQPDRLIRKRVGYRTASEVQLRVQAINRVARPEESGGSVGNGMQARHIMQSHVAADLEVRNGTIHR
jgi:hypothetical protein